MGIVFCVIEVIGIIGGAAAGYGLELVLRGTIKYLSN
jgi:hypothetical protein